MKPGYEHLRTVELQPFRDGHYSRYELTLWDTHRTDKYGKSILAYRFQRRYARAYGNVLFEGEDFHCSPLKSIDGDDTLRQLLGFLTLRPGDTDAEYFENYNDDQLEFAEQEAESLQVYADEDSDDPLLEVHWYVFSVLPESKRLFINGPFDSRETIDKLLQPRPHWVVRFVGGEAGEQEYLT